MKFELVEDLRHPAHAQTALVESEPITAELHIQPTAGQFASQVLENL